MRVINYKMENALSGAVVWLAGWFSIGVVFLLTGKLFVLDGSRYSVLVNVLLMFPGLLLIVLNLRRLRVATAELAFFALFSWVLISAAFLSPGAEFGHWFSVLIRIFVFVVGVGLVFSDKRFLVPVLVCSVVVAMLFAWLSLIQNYVVNDHSLAYRAHRISSMEWKGFADFKNPLVSAIYYGVMASFAFVLYPWVKGWLLRSLWTAGLLGLVAFVFFTFSRGVWVALFLSFAVGAAFMLSVRLFKLILAAALMFLLVGFALFSDVILRVFQSLNHREEIWSYTLREVADSWLLGRGADTDFSACVAVLDRCFNQAHSVYLQTLFNFGILGVALLVGLLLLSLWRGIALRAEASASLASAPLTFAIIGAIASYHDIFARPGVMWVVFWFPLALMLASRRIAKSASHAAA